VTTFSFRQGRVLVVGILNVTPDSFSDGGQHVNVAHAVEHARRMIDDGADVIDIGGESTRPGASDVSEDEELRRVLSVIEPVATLGVPVSIDTRRTAVAEAAIASGAAIINDVSGLRDPAMIEVAATARVPVVIMHTPSPDLAAAHRHEGHSDVVAEVRTFLARQAERALAAGVPEVAIDPGIGFGKTFDENIALINELEALVELGHPVFVGASRKRLIGTLTGIDKPAQRDPGSVAMHLAAVARGATIVRVHDVASHVQALAVWRSVGIIVAE
jgi:dihydropteroate synthase